MSTHTSMAATWSLPQHFSQFADSGRLVIVPKGGPPIAAKAIIGEEERVESDNATQVTYERKVTISIDANSPYYSGIADLKLNATVTIDQVEYAVHKIATAADGFATFVAMRNLTTELSRPNYRDRQSYVDKLGRY